MQKRIKLQKMLIGGLALIIAVLVVGLLAGRNDTVPVLIINSDSIDLTKTLYEQQESLIMQKMSKEDFDRFGGTIVTNLSQIEGAKLKFPLEKGSPIITSALTKTQTAGQFAVNTPLYHTVYKMPEILGTLPPGIQVGDRIDIDLMISTGKNGEFMIGQLLDSVKVSGVDETTLYLMVSQREYATLTLARQIGSFVVQLPGQKEVVTCEDLKEKILLEKEKEIVALGEAEAFKALSLEDQESRMRDLELKYTERLESNECIKDNDKPTTLTSDLIIEKVKEGKSFEEIFQTEATNTGFFEADTQDNEKDQEEENADKVE